MGIEFGKNKVIKETNPADLEKAEIHRPDEKDSQDLQDPLNKLSHEDILKIHRALEDLERRKPQGGLQKEKNPFGECNLPAAEGGSPIANSNLSAKQESVQPDEDPINEGGIVPPPY